MAKKVDAKILIPIIKELKTLQEIEGYKDYTYNLRKRINSAIESLATIVVENTDIKLVEASPELYYWNCPICDSRSKLQVKPKEPERCGICEQSFIISFVHKDS